jgi:two-component system, chemotaxis family, chemotaxis protein CheY
MKSRILVVDDSAVIRALHTYILKSEGFEALEADNGFTALEVLNNHPCHLAIIDVNMPRMDGFTLIRKIRSNPATQEMPIIVVSTQQEAIDHSKGLEAGANAYLIKPTDPDILIDKVRSLLNRNCSGKAFAVENS